MKKISVIIPTYYRNQILPEAIESALQQDYDPIELIVVDDSGEGNAVPVIDRYEDVIGIVRNENGGWGEAFTTGIKASTGQYIQFLDDDDVLFEEKLSKTAEVLANAPDVGVSYCGVEVGDDRSVSPDPEMTGDVLKNILDFDNFPCYTSSMLIERGLLEEKIPLPQLPAANDINLMIELAKKTRFDYVDECLVYKRELEDSMWQGLNKIDGMKQVLSRHSDLYDEYPRIRRARLGEIYELEGRYRLDRQKWSARAILCFAKSAYFAPTNRSRHTVELISSFFGQPGYNIARRLRDLVFLR